MDNLNNLSLYKAKLFDSICMLDKKNLPLSEWIKEWISIFTSVYEVYEFALYERNDYGYSQMMTSNNEEGRLDHLLTVAEVEGIFNNNPYYFVENIQHYSSGFCFSLDSEYPSYILFCNFTNQYSEGNPKSTLDILQTTEYFLQKSMAVQRALSEDDRYRELYKVTEVFHSSMDMDVLLSEVIQTLRKVFPDYTYFLYLANDPHEYVDLPIKNFDYDQASQAAMETFVSGEITIEQGCNEVLKNLYAPLKGKQGVYGILRVATNATFHFPDGDKEFIKLLAYTAGSALENAKLYQQSKRLVSDLQLINETSHKLNSNLRLSETLTFLNRQIQKSMDATEIGFVFFTEGLHPYSILPGSSEFFHTHLGKSYIEFALTRINNEKDALFIGDMEGKREDLHEYRSLMTVPMVQNSDVIGFCIVLQSLPYAFSFDMYKLLQSFIHHSTLALTNSMLREKLEEMVITDHLTKLYSRNHLDEFISRSMLEDEKGCLVLVDIDNFKRVNDTYGHQVGDEVIVQVANLMSSTSKGKGLAARWGGEELAIYFPHLSIGEAEPYVESIINDCPLATNPKVTLSAGVSSWKKGFMYTEDSLFHKADTALYEAKRTGKNKYVKDSSLESVL
ncbi:diguanylate cyclase [Bacillus coahuilensis m2-6]|uniref:sensor domain-containing diguanylate cyclase n=1 Tax=Bacillus coahuilensis TaxID=408580 RepID=UPI0001850861|nr:diguanylate cyclase [Bacillus coahuilensis]KUP06690.1 diguanylate cyclase [Bacillus coahuilensis m2-6]